jgi:hypothetical protein
MLKPVIVAAAVGALVACAGVTGNEAPGSLPAGGAETCDTGAYQYLVGQKEADIEKTRLPGAFRIVCHNCAMTMDFNPQRLTVRLGADGKVESASCG